MGSGLTSPAPPPSVTSITETIREQDMAMDGGDFIPASYQNILRLNILEGIPLKFHRPINIILYGCEYSYIEEIGKFLSEKLQCPIVGREGITSIEQSNHHNLLINYPKNFQESLTLQSMTPSHETIAIFIRCHVRGLYSQIQQKWIHKASGRCYNTISSPPKSMTGSITEPLTMFDDETNEPLEPEITANEFFETIRQYETIRQEMWSHWISFRYAVDGDVKLEVAKSNFIHLLSNLIAHQPPVSLRVITSSGAVKVISNCGQYKQSIRKKREVGGEERQAL